MSDLVNYDKLKNNQAALRQDFLDSQSEIRAFYYNRENEEKKELALTFIKDIAKRLKDLVYFDEKVDVNFKRNFFFKHIKYNLIYGIFYGTYKNEDYENHFILKIIDEMGYIGKGWTFNG